MADSCSSIQGEACHIEVAKGYGACSYAMPCQFDDMLLLQTWQLL